MKLHLLNTNFACCLVLLLQVTVANNLRAQDSARGLSPNARLKKLLSRLDEISARGFVKTRRPGDTGVGYTLESLLRIPENNSPHGDFMGLEIKAHREGKSHRHGNRRRNLFLKEPVWLDSLTAVERIQRYGYVDDAGRRAWYQSVTSRQNQTGLRLQVDNASQVLQLRRHDVVIGTWAFETLAQRLTEKLSEVVFVSAAARGFGSDEHFHYTQVVYCAKPSVQKFLQLVTDGEVILELRMHVHKHTSARNHGSAFRIRSDRLSDLFEHRILCRPLTSPAAPSRQPHETQNRSH